MSLIKKLTLPALMLTLLSFTTACGGAAGSGFGSTTSGGGEYTGSNLEGGAVTQVELDDDNTGTIDLSSSSDTAEYILALYSYDSTGSTNAYEISNSVSGPEALERILNRTDQNEDVTEDFHGALRDMEANISSDDREASFSRSQAITRAVEEEVGDERDFEVLSSLSSGSSFTTVSATLVAKTDNVYCYMDSRDLSSLSTEEVETLMTEFDSHIATERSLYGTESDVDNNDHFYILMTREVNELGASQGGIITGFFYAADIIDRDIEVFYTLVPDPSGTHGTAISKSFTKTNILPSVFLHEYQHMINFNQHFFVNDTSTEISAVNEGLSHLAEDIPYDFEESSLENPARVDTYLSQTDSVCITCGSSLAQRGGMYLMLKYLYEQADKGNLPGSANGSEFITNMLTSGYRGVTNIVNAAYGTTSDTDARFADLLGQYGLAVFMSDTDLSTDDRFNFEGIGLRESQDDNRGTTLSGPAIESLGDSGLSGTIGGTSVSYIYITPDDIANLGGTLHVSLSNDAVGGAYLIQIGE